MMAHFLESITQLVECAICTDELSDPRILSCYHSFCMKCISSTIKKSSAPNAMYILCPTCRQRTDFPEENLNKLPVDFRTVQMKQLVEGTEQKRVLFCDICSGSHDKKCGTPADAFCNQCTLLFCSECLTKHQENKLTSNHYVTNLSAGETEGTAICELHKNTANWYCLQCREAVCFHCTLADTHSGHDIQPPDTAYKLVISKVKETIEDIKANCIDASPEEEIKRLQLEQNTAREQCQRVRDMIKNHSVALVARLKSEEHKLLKDVTDFEEKHEKQTSEFITKLEKVCQHQSNCHVDECGDTDLKAVSKQEELLGELTELVEVLAKKELSATAVPQFNPESSLGVGVFTTECKSTNDESIVVNTNKENPFPEAKSDQTGDAKSTKAVIRRTFVNITKLSGSECSPVLLVQSIKWSIMIQKYTGNKEKTFGIFLKCDKSMMSNRKCRVDATLTLVNQAGLASLTKKISHHTFTKKECDWGFREFITWDKLVDPSIGYIKDNEIVVEIQMDVFEPTAL